MDTLEIFSRRLKNARIMKGYSMDDLSKAMNCVVSKMSISKFESGQLKPNGTTLINLSKALDQPIDYFFRSFSIVIESIEFRKKASLGKKKEESIKEQVADIVERYSTIEEICNMSVPFSTLPGIVRTPEDAREKARKVRTMWNIGADGIVNVIALLEENGIKIVQIDAPMSFDGLSSLVNGIQPVIVLNKNFASERMRFTAMHELGHLIMNIDKSIEGKAAESICHAFANEILLPEEVFRNVVGFRRRDITYPELEYLQKQFGISCDAIMHKAKDINIVSDSGYRQFCIKKNSFPEYRSLIEKSIYPPETTSRFEKLVYQALSRELISTSNAAALLNLSIADVNRNLNYS